ncbi:hypothetical protein WM019_03495 [Bifidobacterium mongoliense]|uniref:hypothetical protein n=1 Tax=Bifidobacterium mongoliense TaxID=518643 RepID=UPI0030ECC039
MDQHVTNKNEGLQNLFQMLAVEFGPGLVDMGKQFLDDTLRNVTDSSTSDGVHEKSKPQSESKSTPIPESKSKKHSHGQPSGSQHDNVRSDCDEKRDTAESRQDGDKQQTGRRNDPMPSCGAQKITMIVTNADVIGVFKTIVEQAGEVRKFEEVQKTQRADISARRDIAIAKIEAQKEALQSYLDKSFDERKENFNTLFAVVDHALATNDMQELAMSLQGILTLADTSPFKDLQTVEATATALADPNHEWDF